MDQFGAYLNYVLWNSTLNRFTNIERFEDKVFDLKIAGFNGKYSAKAFILYCNRMAQFLLRYYIKTFKGPGKKDRRLTESK